MRIALAQINTTIGDFDGNAAKILDWLDRARGKGADLCLFPELAVCGYPPRDLLEKPSFIEANLRAIEEIASKVGRTAAVVGFVSRNDSAEGRALRNSAAFIEGGKVRFVQHKMLLPQYDVFDEGRHFEPASEQGVVEFAGQKLGVTLCEDLWSRFQFRGRRLYRVDPAEILAGKGAGMLVNISASPYTVGKQRTRIDLISGEAKMGSLPIFYCNMVGGDDELVFDGRSFAVDARGQIIAEAAAFEEDLVVVDSEAAGGSAGPSHMPEDEEVWRALALGLCDYMGKCGFARAFLGLSGGIDSAVVAAIAADAVGPDRITGVLMPSPFTSKASVDDATALAKNLGIKTLTISIGDVYEAYRAALGFSSGAGEVSLAEENLQARVRGNLLMALSNREGAMVISTGNKSELSVGYCTLYGDMAGGFALISDIPKTMVFDLARYANRGGERIPESIIAKPPSAELRPGQADTDSLPEYSVLDPILRLYIEDRMSAQEIQAKGFDPAVVARVLRMIDRNEYKRRQAPPGIKITMKAFGMGRRFPIARKT